MEPCESGHEVKAGGMSYWTKWRPAWVLMMCWALHAGAFASTCTKSVRWYDDGAYSFRGADGQPTGLYVELVREALRRMDCSAQWQEMPWARGLVELEAGKLDILPGARKTPERDKFAYFSRPLNRSPNVLFMSKAASQRFQFTRLADMVGTDFKLGVQLGVAYGAEYDELIKTPEFLARTQALTSRRSAWSLLQIGRLDGLISDEVTAWVELQSLGLSATVVRTRVVTSDAPGLLALSRLSNTAEFVAALDRNLQTMIADGSYKRIREKFVPCVTSAETLSCR